MTDLKMIENKLAVATAMRRNLVRDLQALEERAKKQASDAKRKFKALNMIRTAARAMQDTIHARVSVLVSECLASVFGPDAYEFKLVFEEKRGRVEARPVFVRDGMEHSYDEIGGGVVDVASFALRLAALTLRRPSVRPMIVLDEPFRFLSKEYRPAVRELLLKLSEKLNFQIIQVTHAPELVCGDVIEIQ